MSGTLMDLFIQIIAGIIGGHAAGAVIKDCTVGAIGNTIMGAIGGVIGSLLLQAAVPALAGSAGSVDIGALAGQVIGGGGGGFLLTVIAGGLKWMLTPPKST
jgi:uncharacterized membrane protein YeaQ/YmgE (transglycosylase-associated protein family)